MGTIEKFNNLTFVASFLVDADGWLNVWMNALDWIKLNWNKHEMKCVQLQQVHGNTSWQWMKQILIHLKG